MAKGKGEGRKAVICNNADYDIGRDSVSTKEHQD